MATFKHLFSCQPSQKIQNKYLQKMSQLGREMTPNIPVETSQKNRWFLKILDPQLNILQGLIFCDQVGYCEKFIFLVTRKMYYNVNLVLLEFRQKKAKLIPLKIQKMLPFSLLLFQSLLFFSDDQSEQFVTFQFEFVIKLILTY